MSNNPEEPKKKKARDTTTKNPSAPKPNQSPETQDMEALKQWRAQIGDFMRLAQRTARGSETVQLYDCCTSLSRHIQRKGGGAHTSRVNHHSKEKKKTVIDKQTIIHPQRRKCQAWAPDGSRGNIAPP